MKVLKAQSVSTSLAHKVTSSSYWVLPTGVHLLGSTCWVLPTGFHLLGSACWFPLAWFNLLGSTSWVLPAWFYQLGHIGNQLLPSFCCRSNLGFWFSLNSSFRICVFVLYFFYCSSDCDLLRRFVEKKIKFTEDVKNNWAPKSRPCGYWGAVTWRCPCGFIFLSDLYLTLPPTPNSSTAAWNLIPPVNRCRGTQIEAMSLVAV